MSDIDMTNVRLYTPDQLSQEPEIAAEQLPGDAAAALRDGRAYWERDAHVYVYAVPIRDSWIRQAYGYWWLVKIDSPADPDEAQKRVLEDLVHTVWGAT